MDLVTPAIGLIFWTVLIFLILLALLYKFAWKPILGAVKQRNKNIQDAMNSADQARKEISKLKSENELTLKEARLERDKILKEARDLKDKMVSESKDLAKTEADKIIAQAKASIQNEKHAAINEIKNTVAALSVEIAEKILARELSDSDEQNKLIEGLLNDSNIN
jgi:F-type H+-transporting ATPase subunit b